ncbi:lysozyme inhibitor LprI family protein [Amorphus sp. MBR-141]
MSRLSTFLLSAAVAAALAGPAAAQSFDCANAAKPDEKAICGSRELANLDVKMATLYEVTTSLVAMGSRGAIQDDQRAFLETRGACGADVACIRSAYQSRIAALEDVVKRIAANGPY